MNCIDEINKIYSMPLQELTYREVKEFGRGLDDVKLGSLLMFYDRERDYILILEGDEYPTVLNYVNKALHMNEEEVTNKLLRFKTSTAIQVFRVMLEVVMTREHVKQKTTEIPKSPNNRFISLDDSIIQVNKIISVKKYGDTAIDILTTGRNASVRKIYPTKKVRDYELRKIEKTLLEIA